MLCSKAPTQEEEEQPPAEVDPEAAGKGFSFFSESVERSAIRSWVWGGGGGGVRRFKVLDLALDVGYGCSRRCVFSCAGLCLRSRDDINDINNQFNLSLSNILFEHDGDGGDGGGGGRGGGGGGSSGSSSRSRNRNNVDP